MTSCDITDSLVQGSILKMSALNRKFNSLQRMGVLLEQAADPTTLVPYLPSLIPLSALTVESYLQLRASCPFLNLPDPSIGIAQLQALLGNAYLSIIEMLQAHPWSRLHKLQLSLDKLQARANFNFSEILQFMRCAQEACRAAGNLSAELSANQAVVDSFQANFIDNTSGVLTASMRDKVDKVDQMVFELKELSQ